MSRCNGRCMTLEEQGFEKIKQDDLIIYKGKAVKIVFDLEHHGYYTDGTTWTSALDQQAYYQNGIRLVLEELGWKKKGSN